MDLGDRNRKRLIYRWQAHDFITYHISNITCNCSFTSGGNFECEYGLILEKIERGFKIFIVRMNSFRFLDSSIPLYGIIFIKYKSCRHRTDIILDKLAV